MDFNIAVAHEAISRVLGSADCVVAGERRFSWDEVTERTRRFASFLISCGLGTVRPRMEIAASRTGQDHIAIYMYNSVEYLEAMIGAFKARVVPANVNYRYREGELIRLFRDCQPRAIIFGASLRQNLSQVLPHLPAEIVLVQVPDEDGVPLLPGAVDYNEVVSRTPITVDTTQCSPDDFYIVYTGGTTGYPKGVLWRQADIFVAGMAGRQRDGSEYSTLDELRQTAMHGHTRVLPIPPFMHNAGLWGAFGTWFRGGVVVIQRNVSHFDPVDVWETVQRERVTRLLMVGDAFARPLLDAFEARPYDVTALRTVVSGGAALSLGLKHRLASTLDVRVVDLVGSSETGGQAVQTTDDGPAQRSFEPTDATVVLNASRTRILREYTGESGWLASTGRIPSGYLNDEEASSRTFMKVDGVRCAISGDIARLEIDGRITLLGRDSVTINSGGEKIFAEEVEEVLKQQAGVRDALVVGRPSVRWGEEVVALVQLDPDIEESAEFAAWLKAACKQEIADYKAPKDVIFVPKVVRSPSGKADYNWARMLARQRQAAEFVPAPSDDRSSREPSSRSVPEAVAQQQSWQSIDHDNSSTDMETAE
jgi:3-oxocholest-4-en-26-oate---CoA ligase